MTVTRKALPMVAILAVVAAFGMVPFGPALQTISMLPG